MAPKRRLFQPSTAAPPRDEVLSLGFRSPPPKPATASLEDDLRLVTDEPDDDLAVAKMARVMRSRGEELRAKWGDETYAQVANTFRSRIANTPMQHGQLGPGPGEQAAGAGSMILRAPSYGYEKLSTPLTPEDRQYLGSPDASGYERVMGDVVDILAPQDKENVTTSEAVPVNALRKGVFGTATLIGTAIPDLTHAASSMVGAAAANQAFGSPGGPSATDQAIGMLTPVQTAGEVMTSLPAVGASMVGADPNQLPGILARSEAYLADLGGRVYDNPIEPIVGGLMAAGLAKGTIAGKRRLFGPREAPPTPAQPVTPDAAQAAGDFRFEQRQAPVVPDVNDVPIGDLTDSAGPVQPRVIQPQQVPGVAEGRTSLAQPPSEQAAARPAAIDRRAVTTVPDEIPQPTRGPIVVQPGSRPRAVDVPDTVTQLAPQKEPLIVVDRRAAPPERQPETPVPVQQPEPTQAPPATPPPEPGPDLSMSDVDAMIEKAKAQDVTITERQIAPGKKRLSIRGPGPGTVRPVKRFGSKGRGGAVAIPSLADIRDNVRLIGRDIVGAAQQFAGRNTPRPAPPPGSPGGPGTGTPFIVETLRPVLRAAASPRTLIGAAFENVSHPSAKGSFWERTGINALATQVNRIANTFDMDSTKFLFGDDQGKTWLREQFQKAGRDLWSAVVTFREGGELSPVEHAAVTQHRHIFDQFVGPAFKFLDHVRQLNVFRDLGETYWPYDWGTLADIHNVLGDERPGWTPGKGVGPDKVRTTTDAPLRNPVDVIDGYRAALRDKITRRQMLHQLEEFAPKLDERGKKMLSEWVNGVLFKRAVGIDTWARDFLVGDALKKHPKPGDAFDLDGGFELEGSLRVVEDAYTSPTKGQTYWVDIDGRRWPVAFSGPELAALKLGKKFPSPNPVTAIVNAVNKAASYNAIANNMRSLWRQLMGGQARFIAETPVQDYSYGHQRAAEYFLNKMPETDLRMLRESGILEGETSVQGLDLAKSSLSKGLFWNVYLPDTQTKIAAWFAEWNKLGRETPGMPREARMDAATNFSLRVSDLNLSMVQAPWGNNPVVALLGLFNKSRLRELRHVANMSPIQAGRYAGTAGAALVGMQVLGNLNKKEMKSVLWSTLPFGELAGEVLQKADLPGGAVNRHGSMFGAAGLDIPMGYVPDVLGVALKTLSDVAHGRRLGPTVRDSADEVDARMRRIFPLKAAYRTASDAVRATLGDSKARNQQGRDVSPARAARASVVTAPQPPYQTEYQKDRIKEKGAESREESGYHPSGGRRGNRKKRLFKGF